MKSWLKRLFAHPPAKIQTPEEAAELALRVFPRCC